MQILMPASGVRPETIPGKPPGDVYAGPYSSARVNPAVRSWRRARLTGAVAKDQSVSPQSLERRPAYSRKVATIETYWHTREGIHPYVQPL